jgi:transcriptional regulator with XRE-family HTH domain
MGFPERLKELREAKNLSQEELADKLNIPRSSVSHYERPQKDNEIRLPRRERLEKIADFFGVSVDYLLGRTDDPEPEKNAPKSTGFSLFFHDGLEGYDELTPEEQEAFREHMREEAKRAIEFAKRLKKK